MSLQYNITLEVAAALYTLMMYIFLVIQYPVKTEMNREFRKLVILCFLTTVLDVVTGITISYGACIPPMLNCIFNTVYLTVSAIYGYQFVYYALCFVYDAPESQLSMRMNQVVCGLYFVLLFVNLFTGLVFSFDEQGRYIHGPVYLISFFIPFYFMIYAAIHFVRENDRCSKRQKIALWTGVGISMGGCLLQPIFFPDILMGMFAVSLAMFIMLFTLETPNFQKLNQTMEELESTKQQAEQAKNRAQDANKAKSRFLTNVSREVKTPIAAILEYDEKILEESNEAKIKEYAVYVRSSGRMLLSMMNDILDFTSLDEGKIKLDKKPYSSVSLIQDICCYAEYAAAQKNLKLVLRIDKWIPQELSGDAARLLQVVGNLISNAQKFTEKGSIEISLMWEGTNQEEGSIEFQIKDTGIGMKEEDIRNISDSFVRFDSQRNSNVRGLGLGLSIVMLLLESMDSHLETISEYGKGTTFSFVVKQGIVSNHPIGKSDFYGNLESEDAESLPVYAPEARILMADDNIIHQDCFRKILKKSGIVIDVAGNGQEVISKARKYKYDLIFIDSIMPGMDGIETLEILCEEKLCMRTPIIAMGAQEIDQVREEYLNKGFSDYLQKPFQITRLGEILKSYLDTTIWMEK